MCNIHKEVIIVEERSEQFFSTDKLTVHISRLLLVKYSQLSVLKFVGHLHKIMVEKIPK